MAAEIFVKFKATNVYVDIDLTPGPGQRYEDRIVIAACQALTEKLGMIFGNPKLDVDFSVTENGMPRMNDKEAIVN